jgi:hypothetical protein
MTNQLSFSVDSFLNNKEIEQVLKFYKNLQKTLHNEEGTKVYTTGFVWQDHLYFSKVLNERLKPYLQGSKVTLSYVLEEHTPLSVHTDFFNHNDPNPGRVFLIPLMFKGTSENASTVVFNELGNTEKWRESLKVIQYPYSKTEKKMLTHINEDLIKKISPLRIHDWQPGKLIVWDRKLLHCSDNFLENGVTSKTALVIFSAYDTNES